MAGGNDTESPPWAGLPPELVGIVLRRLPTLADRVRLRAVCRSWRHEPLPTPFPWLGLLDGTFLSVPDGEVHRFPTLPGVGGDGGRTCCHGSVGNWLFLTSHHTGRNAGGGSSLSLANPFTGDAVPLPDVAYMWNHGEGEARDAAGYPRRPAAVSKLVQLAPSRLGAPPAGSLFAALMATAAGAASVISICRPPAAFATAFKLPAGEDAYDVAFLDGKLYAITYRQLYIIDIDAIASSKHGKPEIPPMRSIANFLDTRWSPRQVTVGNETYSCHHWSYLVASGGRLLHVRRLIGYPCTAARGLETAARARTLSFEIFEADLSVRFCFPWKRVTTLGGGQAVFVGKYSESVTASECGAREDCVYFVREYCGRAVWDPLGDSGVFDMRNGAITPLLPETVVAPPLGECLHRGCPAWFFQTEVL